MATPSTRASSTSGSQTGIVRCNVVLPNGRSVRVPISEDAAVAELHQAAVIRGAATARDFPFTVESTVLKLGGKDAAYLWHEDKISDVVEDAGNHIFHLAALDGSDPSSAHMSSHNQAFNRNSRPRRHRDYSNSSPDLISFSSSSSGTISTRIRWVVPETAMAAGRTIDSLAVEREPLPMTTTIAELGHLAARKFSSLRVTIGHLPAGTTPTMYTKSCQLSSPELKDISLSELGLVNSAAEPLTIFLVPTRTSSTSVREALGFQTSDRALSTFITSLRLFISKIANNNHKLENFLEVIWELTHFPPAAIALRQVIFDNQIEPQPCAVFAACFRELCLQIVPPKFYGSQDDVLLVSRHVFSWLCSLRSHSSTLLKSSHTIVHTVEIRRPSTQSILSTSGRQTYDEHVQIPGLNPFSGANVGHDDQNVQQLVVCRERVDGVTSNMLALALNEGKDRVVRCYFDLPSDFDSFTSHKRRKLLDRTEFVNLLHTVNQDEFFRIIGPFQLSQCPGPVLPVATLDEAGYVSLYDRQDLNCDDKYTFTWNVIKGEEKLPATEPGHYLFQKLEPLIVERKKNGTWQIDAWEEGKPGTFGGPPYEAVVVCVDVSGSMSSAMPETWFENYAAASDSKKQLSRLTEVKEFFKNFMVRLNAYRVSTDIGLVAFATRTDVRTHQPLTRVVLDLQHALESVRTGSLTALWDGIRRSCEMLVEHKTKHPNVRLRIIALTDGLDNDSQAVPADICAELYNHDIVLDAIVIDTDSTDDLFKVAKHTGGYAFHPQNRNALFQIFLLETFIDIRTRPDVVKVPVGDYALSNPKPADLKTMFDLPPCRPHENQNDHFIALADAALFLRRVNRSSTIGRLRGPSSVSSGSSSVVSGRTRIFMDQVQNAISHAHESIDIYVSENNMGFWKVVMQGRPDTPYANGVFLLYLEIGDDYPSKPPTMRFITPILHPNVSKHGRICHQIFDRSWDPDFSIMQVIQHVWDLLVLVESADAIDPISAVRFYTDQDSAERLISQYITRFALKTRAQHRVDICGPDSPVPSIRSNRANSVISLSNTSSSSWQSIGSQRNPSNLSTQLTASALNNLQQQGNLRGPAYRNPGETGRPGDTSSNSSMQAVKIPATTSAPAAGGGPGQNRSTGTTASPPTSSSSNQVPQLTGGAGNNSNRNSAGTRNYGIAPARSPTGSHGSGQHPYAANSSVPRSSPLNPPRIPPTASTATLPVSRRASFFRRIFD